MTQGEMIASRAAMKKEKFLDEGLKREGMRLCDVRRRIEIVGEIKELE